MNPGKNDNVYIGKCDGVKQYEQKRFFLWPLRDVLGILNGSEISGNECYTQMFGQNLTFTLFYRFVKMHQECIFNKKIPHYTCLCEVCENVVLMSKGMGHACKTKTIPTDPHTIVE